MRPLLEAAGLGDIRISLRQIHVDAERPDLVDGFIRRTFTAMVAGVRDEAVRVGLTDPDAFDAGIRALLQTMGPDGMYRYTFFKAVGFKQ